MRYRRSKVSLALLSAGLLLAPVTAFANEVQSKICAPLSTPTITAPAAGSETDLASVQVTGYAQPGKTVVLTKNNINSGATTATADGTYALVSPLEHGNNILRVSVSNSCATVKKSISVAIRRIETAPSPEPSAQQQPPAASPAPQATEAAPVIVSSLTETPVAPSSTDTPAASQTAQLAPTTSEPDNATTVTQKEVITQPHEGQTVKSDRMWVKGEALPSSAVVVYVNKQIAAQVVSDAFGAYGVLVEVKNGANTIHVKAKAKDGTETTRVISVQLVKSTDATPVAPTRGNNDTLARSISVAIGVGSLLIMGGIYHEIRHLNHMRRHKGA